jgi:glycosyltransferase involved in cell wall biosynthesis
VRIAVVNNFFPPRVGGSAHLSDLLARGYVQAGHEVLVLTAAYGDEPTDEVKHGYRIVRLPSWTLPATPFSVNFDLQFTLRPGLMRRVRRVLDEFRPDVLHQHGQFFDLTWASGRYARARDIPTLLTVHTRLEDPKPLTHTVFRMMDAVLVAPILRHYRPDFVVTDTLMQEYIDARYRRAVRSATYIPVGVDPDSHLGGDGARVREKHGLGDRPVIVSIGHVIAVRDRKRLIRALPHVLEKYPELAVLIVGGVFYDAFRALAAELGVAHAVHVVGKVPREEVRDYLAAAACEVHDLNAWGLGTASLESMAAGCPVVAALRPDNYPGKRVVDREHIYLVPAPKDASRDERELADAIIEVLADPVRARETVGVNGRRFIIEHLTLDSVLSRHLRTLESITEAAKHGSTSDEPASEASAN